MSLLPVRVLGDPVLRRRAEEIRAVTDETRRLADDMYETMYAAHGIGLAAPQVGVSERLFITDVEGEKYVMVNPELVRTDGGVETAEEGCLSIPEILGDVPRPSRVVMSATNFPPGTPIVVIFFRSSTASASSGGRIPSRFTSSRISTPSFTDCLLISAAFA